MCCVCACVCVCFVYAFMGGVCTRCVRDMYVMIYICCCIHAHTSTSDVRLDTTSSELTHFTHFPRTLDVSRTFEYDVKNTAQHIEITLEQLEQHVMNACVEKINAWREESWVSQGMDHVKSMT